MRVSVSKVTVPPFDIGDEVFALVHPFSSLAEVRKIRVTKLTFLGYGVLVTGRDEKGEVTVRSQFCFDTLEAAEAKKKEIALE